MNLDKCREKFRSKMHLALFEVIVGLHLKSERERLSSPMKMDDSSVLKDYFKPIKINENINAEIYKKTSSPLRDNFLNNSTFYNIIKKSLLKDQVQKSKGIDKTELELSDITSFQDIDGSLGKAIISSFHEDKNNLKSEEEKMSWGEFKSLCDLLIEDLETIRKYIKKNIKEDIKHYE